LPSSFEPFGNTFEHLIFVLMFEWLRKNDFHLFSPKTTYLQMPQASRHAF
jgi:hypothetical protein